MAASTLSLGSACSSLNGQAVSVSQKATVTRSVSFACRAEKKDEETVSRRAAVSTLLAAAAALSLKPESALAAYGESANVFGKAKTNTDFIPYSGDGFSISIPSKWNPSKETEFPGTVLRYEDNFDALANLAVIVSPTSKKSVTEFGSPEKFISEYGYLLGTQVFTGLTASEGGFEKNATVVANVLESSSVDVGGKTYYKINILVRSADGNEGGRHELFTATVSDGKLYILRTQSGDKRWFKGAKKFVEGADASFVVA